MASEALKQATQNLLKVKTEECLADSQRCLDDAREALHNKDFVKLYKVLGGLPRVFEIRTMITNKANDFGFSEEERTKLLDIKYGRHSKKPSKILRDEDDDTEEEE